MFEWGGGGGGGGKEKEPEKQKHQSQIMNLRTNSMDLLSSTEQALTTLQKDINALLFTYQILKCMYLNPALLLSIGYLFNVPYANE